MWSICRLCAKCKDTTELTTEMSGIKSKMEIFSQWRQSENEGQMPQMACISCVNQLNQSWDFVQTVLAAEEQLNKLISESQPSECLESMPRVEEIIFDTMKLEPIICEEMCADDYENAITTNVPDCNSNDVHSKQSIADSEPIGEIVEKKIVNRAMSDPFLIAINDDDCLADGTINAIGIEKLEKLIPGMKTMSWSDCQYKCKQCNDTFSGVHNFFAHNHSIHFDSVGAMEFFCYYCSYKHRREYMLHRHISTKHFKHLKFGCLYCTDYFWDEQKLAEHRSLHTDVEYKCGLCGKISFNKETLYMHVLLSHRKRSYTDPDEKFSCEICSKSFANKSSIRAHMLTHSRKYDFVCDQCGWKFLTKGNLKAHMKSIHSDEKPFACANCDMRFKTKHQMLNHSLRHEELKRFECKICNKRFRTLNNLGVHKRSHEDVYPYSCQYCERKFRHNCTLRTHERTHTSEKPYVCTQCNYRSTNWANLNKHSTRIHSIDLRTRKTLKIVKPKTEISPQTVITL